MKVFEYNIDSQYSVEKYKGEGQFRYLDNGEIIPQVTDSLYKYMPWNERTISSLLDNYLWLTNPVYFNDPFDCNRNLILNYQFTNQEKQKKSNYFNDIGILSFTENKLSQLMWAHYTGNYNGIVLKFKGDAFKNINIKSQFDKIKLRKVIYPKNFKIFPPFEFAKELMLFIKTNSWSYEREWRLIANLKKPYNRHLRFNSKALEEIYIGYNLFENLESKSVSILTTIRDAFYPKTKLTIVFPDNEVFGQMIFRDWDRILNGINK